jgi:hypothetical protein
VQCYVGLRVIMMVVCRLIRDIVTLVIICPGGIIVIITLADWHRVGGPARTQSAGESEM